MLCSSYIEALLVNEDLADLVWEAWNVGELGDVAASMAWQSMLYLSASVH